MRHHGVPATLTSTGRISPTWSPGEADRLTGRHRWSEVWKRLRQQHPRATSARLLVAAWRHGVALGGPPARRTEQDGGIPNDAITPNDPIKRGI